MSNRKAKSLDPVRAKREQQNIGPVLDTSLGASWDSIVFPDRLLRRLLQDTIDFLLENPEELERFFAHFYDNSVSVEERNQHRDRFLKSPPKAQLGYARPSTEFPYWGITLTEENEEDSFVGDFVGMDPETKTEFDGALFTSMYSVYVYANHPDVCSYQYALAKSTVIGGRKWLMSQGLMEIQLSGGDLAPGEEYFPDAVYLRALRVKCKSLNSVPRILLTQKTRLGAIHNDDVVVNGVRGGVHALDPE